MRKEKFGLDGDVLGAYRYLRSNQQSEAATIGPRTRLDFMGFTAVQETIGA